MSSYSNEPSKSQSQVKLLKRLNPVAIDDYSEKEFLHSMHQHTVDSVRVEDLCKTYLYPLLELVKACASHNLVNQSKHPNLCLMILDSRINKMNILQAVVKQLLEKFV